MQCPEQAESGDRHPHACQADPHPLARFRLAGGEHRQRVCGRPWLRRRGVRTETQPLAHFARALRALFGGQFQCLIDALQEAVAVATLGGLFQRLHAVLDDPLHRRRGCHARDGVPCHGGQRVKVGPRALSDRRVPGVLLGRRVTRPQHGAGTLVADDMARGSEIQQHRLAALGQDDVVGRNVAVVAVLRVNHLQRFQQRPEQVLEPLLVWRFIHVGQRLGEGRAVVERHGHVGRAVGLPEAVHLDQRGMVEAGQQSRLVDEADQAGGKCVGIARRADGHGGAVHAHRQRGGKVLFERHAASERIVLRQVDVAETADADQSGDLEFAQAGSGRQGQVRPAPQRGRQKRPQLRSGPDDGLVGILEVAHGVPDGPSGRLGVSRVSREGFSEPSPGMLCQA